MAAGPGVTGIEGWRVALLLVGFIVVTLSFEGLIEFVEKRLKKRKGLLTAFRALKNELLYLGFLSLLLSVTQDYLAWVCIPETSGSTYSKYKEKYELEDHCAEGKEPLWPVSVQHETHYFIFAVAVTHILYCALTIVLTLHKVATWRPWEDEALAEAKSSSGDVKVMQETVSRSLIRSMCTAALAAMSGHRSALDIMPDVKALITSIAAQFRVSVSHPMYHNVRLLFIERMGLTYDFDFHALVTNGMENQLAHAVHASWPLWMIATLFLVLPSPSYVPFWSYMLVMGLMLVVGAKLVTVTALLGMQVAIKYGDSVLFGRMDMEPRALVRTGPVRRRLSLSQLADALEDAVDGAADGVYAIEGGDGGTGAGGEGGGGGGAHAGAHVLDEALPAGAGAEVQAQIAAVTALTSREQALNMLRTMAAMPLLPVPPTERHVPGPEGLAPMASRQDDTATADAGLVAQAASPFAAAQSAATAAFAAVAAATASAGGNAPSASSTPTLLPSSSLLQAIAPPRWGPRPSIAATPALPIPAPVSHHKKKKKPPPPPPPPLRLPVPPTAVPLPDIPPLSPILKNASSLRAAGTSTTVSPLTATGKTSTLPTLSTGSVMPNQHGGGDITITVLTSDEDTGENGGGGAAAAVTVLNPDVTAPVAASARPSSALRPSMVNISRPASAERPNAARGMTPVLSVLLPPPPGSPSGGSMAPFMATTRPGSRGVNTATTAATWANTTARRNAGRPSAGLMLCGVATSRATNALEQMEDALAIAATAMEMSAAQHPDMTISSPAVTSLAGGVASPAAGEVRPSTPSTVNGGVAGFLASLRPSRVGRTTDDPRPLLDGSRSTDLNDGGIRSPQTTIQAGRLAMTLSHMAGPLTLPIPAESGGDLSTRYTAAHPMVAVATATAAATLMRQLPPRRPIRRCMSARQLICTMHIGDEEFSKTLVRRQAAAGNNATITNGGVCAPKGKAIVLRPGGVQDDSGVGLQVGLDLLPAPQFLAQKKLPPQPAPLAAAASAETGPSDPASSSSSSSPPLIPPIPKFPRFGKGGLPIGFFGPRKKAHRRSDATAELQDGSAAVTASGDGKKPTDTSMVVSTTRAAARPPLSSELLSVTAVAAEILGDSCTETPRKTQATDATAASKDAFAEDASHLEPSGAPPGGALGAAASRPRGTAASAFARFQLKVQQSPVGGEVDLGPAAGCATDYSSVCDSLSLLLPAPPPMSPGTVASRMPGFVRAMGDQHSGTFCDGSGGAGLSLAEAHAGSSSSGPGLRIADASMDHLGISSPPIESLAANQTPRAMPLDVNGVSTASVVAPAVLSSHGTSGTPESLPLPSPPELSSSPSNARPRSGLRVVRMGDDGPWVTVEEAVAMVTGPSAVESIDSVSPSAVGSVRALENPEGAEEREAPIRASSPQQGTSLLLSSASALFGAASLEVPMSARGDTSSASSGSRGCTTAAASVDFLGRGEGFELPEPALASVFSMHTSASLESPWLQPPLQPVSVASDAPSKSSYNGGSVAIRTAAYMGGSGEFPSPDSEQYVDGSNILPHPSESQPRGHTSTVGAGGEFVEGTGEPEPSSTRGLRLVPVATTDETSARADADLPSTPNAGSMPMMSHSLEPVEEGDEEAEAEAESCDEAEENRSELYGARLGVQAQGLAKPSNPVQGQRNSGDNSYGQLDSLRGDFYRGGDPPEESMMEQEGDGDLEGELLEQDLESTFVGFNVVDLNRTAPHIGLSTPTRMAPSVARSFGSRALPASGSALSLLSLAPWGGDGGSGGGSEYVSRAPSEVAERPRMSSGSGASSRPESATTATTMTAAVAKEGGGHGSGAGSRSASRLGVTPSGYERHHTEEDDEMPPPPLPPTASPAAPPPPAHLHLEVPKGAAAAAATGAGGGVIDRNRWAVVVTPSFRGADSRHVISMAEAGSPNPNANSSIRECMLPPGLGGLSQVGPSCAHSRVDPWAGPVCEGSGSLGVDAGSPPPPPDAGNDQGNRNDASGINGTPIVVSPFGEESLRTTAAGLAAGHIWKQRAMDHYEQRHNGNASGDGGGNGNIWHGHNSHISLFARLGVHQDRHSGHHHHHHNHSGHGSDSESDDGGCCQTIWPPCVPKPWHHQRIMPLPAPVRDLKDNLSAGMDKAKVAIASAAGDVTDTVKEKLLGRKQPSKVLQRKISDHWMERVRNMLATHTGFENMDASAFFWFHNPKVIAYIFNWAYYENSLSIAMLLFSLILGYQKEWVFKGVPLWSVLVLLCADLLILIHSCLYVLPLYALIMPVGAHCPKEVLRRALKAGIFTRQTALIAKALHLQLKAREEVAAAAAAAAANGPRSSHVGRIANTFRKRPTLANAVLAHSAAVAFSRAARSSVVDAGGGGGGNGDNVGAMSPAGSGADRAFSPQLRLSGAGLRPNVSTADRAAAGKLSPGGDALSPTAAKDAGLGGVMAFTAIDPVKRSSGKGSGGNGDGRGDPYNTSLKVIDLTETGQSVDRVSTGPVHGSDMVKPVLLPRKDVTAAPGDGSSDVCIVDGGGGGTVSGPPAAAEKPSPAPTSSVPTPGRGRPARQSGVEPAPSRFSRLLQPFRGTSTAASAFTTAAPRIGSGAAAATNPPRDVNSHHSMISNPDDAVVPFMASGGASSPIGPAQGTAAVAATSAAANVQSPSSPTDLMDLSLVRGAGLERQGSQDSLSSSLGRSGTIRTLMAGMYRGAVTHLTPEERRVAAATGIALGRAGRGRALDMTLVPEK